MHCFRRIPIIDILMKNLQRLSYLYHLRNLLNYPYMIHEFYSWVLILCTPVLKKILVVFPTYQKAE